MAKKKINKLFEPKIMTYLCNWSGFTETDVLTAGAIQGSPSIKVKRVVCSGTIEPALILETLNQGNDGVLICGCHLKQCHYINGNYKARRRIKLLKEILPQFGFESERLRLTWIGASDGIQFAEIMRELVSQIKVLGPNTAKLKMVI